MKVHEIMTAHARCVGPDNTLVEAAGLMREMDVGALPVCENDRLLGMVTDRDIVLRGTADGRDPNTTSVREVMSNGVVWVRAEQDVEEAVRMMEGRQVRRLPVIGRNERIVGIVSLGDIACSSNPAFSGMALRDVSEQRDPSARQQRLSARSAPMRQSLNANGTRSAAAPEKTARRTRAVQKKSAATRKRAARKVGGKRRQSASAKTSRRAAR